MKKSSFVEGTIIATLAIIITKILGMLYVIPFAAMIGASGSALYAYGYNIYAIFLDISTAGLPLALSKIIKEYNTLKMVDAKRRAFLLGIKLVSIISIAMFLILFLFAPLIAHLILGELQGGTTIEEVSFVIRMTSFAILIVPYLSITRGYLQGHNIIGTSSISQVLEQVFRILTILGGSFLALYIFKISMKYAIGIAVFGASIGGLVAITYLLCKMYRSRKELGLEKVKESDDISDKEIGKKIISYAIPFIIITIAFSINNFLDMVMILRTLNALGLETAEIEFATTAITTWSTKISMIVNSVATGMVTSLIPTIVGAYTLKNWGEVNSKLNKALQLILFICIPMCVGLSLLSKSVWSVFYGYSEIGAIIFSMQILVSLFYNIFLITNSTLHGLNKSKVVYKSVIIGLSTNVILNIPLMILFYKLGLSPYLGAILSTAIGYIFAFTLSLKKLKKEHDLHYRETFFMAKKLIIPILSMTVVVIILKSLLPVNYMSRISCALYISCISILGSFVYFFITYKMGLINQIFGPSYYHKIIKKLTPKKVR